jgi:hypothetical protein
LWNLPYGDHIVGVSGDPHNEPEVDRNHPEYSIEDRENEDLGSSSNSDSDCPGDDHDESDDEQFLTLHDMYNAGLGMD